MTGAETIEGRFWPTTRAYAVPVTCPDCGGIAWSCPCALADNDATGQGDDGDDAA